MKNIVQTHRAKTRMEKFCGLVSTANTKQPPSLHLLSEINELVDKLNGQLELENAGLAYYLLSEQVDQS